MEELKPKTGKSICIKCLAEITYEEFNDNDGRCDSCALKPNYLEKKRCDKCRHIPHGGLCNEPMTRGEVIHKCECTFNSFNIQTPFDEMKGGLHKITTCDCYKYDKQVCDICQGNKDKDHE